MKEGFSALVADDDEFSRHTAVRLLRRLGAGCVIEASEGDEALLAAAARDGAFDLIVCDLKMPQLDGIELLRGLASGSLSAMIILASSVDARVLRSAHNMATAFGIQSLRTIEKPVTLQKLATIFDEVGALPPSPSAALPATGRTQYEISADDLRRGLAANEIVPYFQPKVHLTTRQVTGAEALARWRHPVHGVLAPDEFLPLVSSQGLFDELTTLMISEAAVRCAGWRRTGLDISVAVNLPVVCLSSRALPPRLEALAQLAGLSPGHMTLEVTEDGWLQNEVVAREVLTRLRLRGFSLAIDDFGTGYSTMRQLLEAPFSEMKIDQSFVRSAPDDEESAAVLASSIDLAHRLGLTVVGEGVETEVQWDLLKDAGCDEMQGFFVARPMPADPFVDWLRAWGGAERKRVLF